MSSRLFQNIRERQGLAYAVFSELSPYRRYRLPFGVCRHLRARIARRVVESVLKEFRDLKDQSVDEEEFAPRQGLPEGFARAWLESNLPRAMSGLARNEIYFGRFFSLDELLESIESVAADGLQELARTFFDSRHIALTIWATWKICT